MEIEKLETELSEIFKKKSIAEDRSTSWFLGSVISWGLGSGLAFLSSPLLGASILFGLPTAGYYGLVIYSKSAKNKFDLNMQQGEKAERDGNMEKAISNYEAIGQYQKIEEIYEKQGKIDKAILAYAWNHDFYKGAKLAINHGMEDISKRLLEEQNTNYRILSTREKEHIKAMARAGYRH